VRRVSGRIALTTHNQEIRRRPLPLLVKITQVENPPLRLQLGHDCVSAVEDKLMQVKEELEQWRELAESTAFAE
jgi:hypothetical protein